MSALVNTRNSAPCEQRWREATQRKRVNEKKKKKEEEKEKEKKKKYKHKKIVPMRSTESESKLDHEIKVEHMTSDAS
jgi:hypothetical protein